MRILLIEDDKKIAEFIEKGLKSSGFAVDHASSGTQGYDMAFDEPYDALIVDIMLPKMDGITLIQKIRDNKNNTRNLFDEVTCLIKLATAFDTRFIVCLLIYLTCLLNRSL